MSFFEKISLRKSKEDELLEEKAFKIVAEELDAGNYLNALKAKAYSLSEGDKEKASALYIRLRAAQIVDDLKKIKQEELNKKIREYRNSKDYQREIKIHRKRNDKIMALLVACFAVIILFLVLISM